MIPVRLLSPALAALALGAAPAVAQQGERPPGADHADEGMIAPLAWPVDDLYAGWRASQVLDAMVISRNGAPIGTVADIVLESSNQANYMVIAVAEPVADQAAGEEGTVRYAVNWGRTRAGEDWPGPMVLDTTRDIVAQGIDAIPEPDLDVPEEADTGWRVAGLMNAPVDMDGELPFGVVDDVIFDDSDVVQGIVVRGTGDYEGLYPVPWQQVVVEHDASVLSVPLSPDAVDTLPQFDYDRMADSVTPND